MCSLEAFNKSMDIFKELPLAMMITDVDGNIEHISPELSKITGYEFEEIKGKKANVFKSDYHPQSFYKDMWDTILSKQSYQSKIQNKKKNGQLYWQHIFIKPIIDDGKIISFFALIQDITESREKFLILKAMMDSTLDTHLLWDGDRKCIDIFPNHFSSYGFQSFIGKYIDNVPYEAEFISIHKELMDKVDKQPEASYSGYINYKRDDITLKLEIIISRFNHCKYYEVIRDITFTERNKELLSKVTDTLSTLFDQLTKSQNILNSKITDRN